MLLISGSLVQVGESPQRGQYSISAVENLHLERVKRGGCRGFRCVNMQPENQVRAGCGGWDGHGLDGGISMRRAIAVMPCIPCSGVRGLRCGVVQYASRHSPRCGRAGFKSTVDDQV